MDDLGAEHLSELSVSDKIVKSVNVKSPDSVPTASTTANPAVNIDTRAIFGGGFTEKSDSVTTPRGRYKDRAIFGIQNYHSHHRNEADEEEVSLSSSDGKEKTDATPENVKKIDDVIQVAKNAPKTSESSTSIKANEVTKTGINGDDDNMAAGAPLSTPNSTIADDDGGDESSSSLAKQQCLAFTIDFGDDSAKETNSAAASAKYKSMVERFQSRHRRGASLSKLEGTEPPMLTTAKDAQTPRSPRAPSETPPIVPDSAGKVKLRARDRSTSRVRDASKRHSWSPRSSTTEPLQQHQSNQNHPKAVAVQLKPVTTTAPTTKKPKTKPPSLQMPPQEPPRRERERHSSGKPFTPRSTAMQMALQKIDFLCPQPPLDDYHHIAMNDNVSEAGTYTLDGDNYTEEQKELMNIDMTTTTSSEVSLVNHLQQQRPRDLPLKNTQTNTTTTTVSSSESRRRNNVLEVSYYHDATSTSFKPTNKTSYLDKIKSRVRNIAVKQQQHQQHQNELKETSPPDADVGTFTSVTTSGVLAKQTTLDSRPKLTRRSSLSTSQIDSSEYVSTEAKLKSNSGAPYNGGYTDHQKAGYRLNVFTNQTDSQILNTIESPESPVSKLSDTAVLKTAQTKNDWIQEWARNARARSVASAVKGSPGKQSNHQDVMSRSFNCAPGHGDEDTLTDDSVVYRNKTIDRFRMGEFDYASDPNVSAQRPPKSPTKIPSPLHTIGRARSASHTRASLQNIIQDDANNTDMYLQKTAAAISNLQQSLSRKNSLKSPPSSMDSPKKQPLRHHHTTHQYYSADEYSPQHSIEAKLLLSNPLHKRATNNLMTNSYHEQLVMDVKIPRARKNSYDAQALTVSPARRHQTLGAKQQQYYAGNIDQTRAAMDSSIKQQQQQNLSPLRRSSSFSAKCKTVANNKRPTATLYTPPAARHNYMAPPVGTSAIKKSASSTTFRHVYSDYDDNLAYYINDEDDLIDVEYYGSSDEDIHSTNVDDDYEDYNDDVSQHVASESVQSSEVPLSNTRYNKALLMRIERSKQKVAGNGSVGGGGANQQLPPKPNLLAGGGMVACPNTPELPRRAVKSAPRSSMRQSMPRDSSLNRLGNHVPNSLASAKKQILQTANAVATPSNTTGQQKRVQPKYMDISKYKPAQGNNFLRKNDAKSTLKPEIRRSPSSASMGLSRTEPTRTSNRSVKSATSGRGTSAARRDASVTKQKEVELAMWKRRATYDPMRAAAEDRRKKEEAKKSSQSGQGGGVTESSTVTRSQSFHYGVGSISGNGQSSASNNEQSLENRWTLTSNESSDEEHAYVSSSTNRS